MEIEIQGKYDKATVFQAVSLANKPSKRNSFFRIGLSVIFTAIFAAYFITVLYDDNLSSIDLLRVIRILLTLPFIALFLLQPYFSSYFVASKLWKKPAMHKNIIGVVSEQCLTYISSTNERKEIDWKSIIKKKTSKSLIVLVTADGVIDFFPRYFFKTDHDWETVKKWVDFKVIQAS
jgi:hypothetical protein